MPLHDLPASPDPHLLALLEALTGAQYQFTSVTPATHARVVARDTMREANSLRDIFGWSLPFAPDTAGDELVGLLDRAGMLERRDDGLLRARIRVSSHGDCLFIHSAWPTDAENAVFFGPDSVRYAMLIEDLAGEMASDARIADYGAGSGIGGIVAALSLPDHAELLLADINPDALRFAAVNAAHAGLTPMTRDVMAPADLPGGHDLILLHPPFMIDASHRTYRDGGDMLGARLSLDWALAAAERLAPGGRVLMHTGVAIVAGEDHLEAALDEGADKAGLDLAYFELETDYYGEELDTPAYRDAGVERIAMVAVVLDKPGA